MIEINSIDCTPYIGDAKLKKIVQGDGHIIWEETTPPTPTEERFFYGSLFDEDIEESGITVSLIKGMDNVEILGQFSIRPVYGPAARNYDKETIHTDEELAQWLNFDASDEEYEQFEIDNTFHYFYVFPSSYSYKIEDEFYTHTLLKIQEINIDGIAYNVYRDAEMGAGFITQYVERWPFQELPLTVTKL